MYKQRLTDLRDKESKMQHDINQRHPLVEDSAFKQRQRILDDMERLREREQAVRRTEVQNAKRAQLEEERLSHKAMLLDRQMRDYEKARREINEAQRQAAEQARDQTNREWEEKIKTSAEMRIEDAKLMQKMREELKQERARNEAKQAELDQERQRLQDLKGNVQELKIRAEMGEEEMQKLKDEKVEHVQQLAEMAALRGHVEELERKLREAQANGDQAVSDVKKAARQHALGAAKAKEMAVQRLHTAILKLKADFKKRQKLYENALKGLQKRLEVKSRQESALDAQRESDRQTIRRLERQLVAANLLKNAAAGVRAIGSVGNDVLNSAPPYHPPHNPHHQQQLYQPLGTNLIAELPLQSTLDMAAVNKINKLREKQGRGPSDDERREIAELEREDHEVILKRETAEAERRNQLYAQGSEWRKSSRGQKSWYPSSSFDKRYHRRRQHPMQHSKARLPNRSTASASAMPKISTSATQERKGGRRTSSAVALQLPKPASPSVNIDKVDTGDDGQVQQRQQEEERRNLISPPVGLPATAHIEDVAANVPGKTQRQTVTEKNAAPLPITRDSGNHHDQKHIVATSSTKMATNQAEANLPVVAPTATPLNVDHSNTTDHISTADNTTPVSSVKVAKPKTTTEMEQLHVTITPVEEELELKKENADAAATTTTTKISEVSGDAKLNEVSTIKSPNMAGVSDEVDGKKLATDKVVDPPIRGHGDSKNGIETETSPVSPKQGSDRTPKANRRGNLSPLASQDSSASLDLDFTGEGTNGDNEFSWMDNLGADDEEF
eukprot:jgi/Bigna1/126362/aug1.2_g1070